MDNMKRMFDPQTIALIGASEKEGSLGRTIIENLLSSPRQIALKSSSPPLQEVTSFLSTYSEQNKSSTSSPSMVTDHRNSRSTSESPGVLSVIIIFIQLVISALSTLTFHGFSPPSPRSTYPPL